MSCCTRRPVGPFGPTRGDEGRPLDLHASGVWRAAGLPGVAVRPLERLRAAAGDDVPDAVPAARAVGAAPDDVLVGHMLEASTAKGTGKPETPGSAPRRNVRRLMREHDLQAPHRVGQAHGPKAHDGTITTAAPDVMWGTDMTATGSITARPSASACMPPSGGPDLRRSVRPSIMMRTAEQN